MGRKKKQRVEQSISQDIFVKEPPKTVQEIAAILTVFSIEISMLYSFMMTFPIDDNYLLIFIPTNPSLEAKIIGLIVDILFLGISIGFILYGLMKIFYKNFNIKNISTKSLSSKHAFLFFVLGMGSAYIIKIFFSNMVFLSFMYIWFIVYLFLNINILKTARLVLIIFITIAFLFGVLYLR